MEALHLVLSTTYHAQLFLEGHTVKPTAPDKVMLFFYPDTLVFTWPHRCKSGSIIKTSRALSPEGQELETTAPVFQITVVVMGLSTNILYSI